MHNGWCTHTTNSNTLLRAYFGATSIQGILSSLVKDILNTGTAEVNKRHFFEDFCFRGQSKCSWR
jgi:hypothetical protein